VTIGRADVYLDFNYSDMKEIIIADDVILCAGCKVLTKDEQLIIRKGTIIAANAVLLNSTGEYEIWAGVPAKKIGMRK
jgi:serine O-acetyltransferase